MCSWHRLFLNCCERPIPQFAAKNRFLASAGQFVLAAGFAQKGVQPPDYPRANFLRLKGRMQGPLISPVRGWCAKSTRREMTTTGRILLAVEQWCIQPLKLRLGEGYVN